MRKVWWLKILLWSGTALVLIAGLAVYVLISEQLASDTGSLVTNVTDGDKGPRYAGDNPAIDSVQYIKGLVRHTNAHKTEGNDSQNPVTVTTRVVNSQNIGPDIDVDDKPQSNSNQNAVTRDIGEDIEVDNLTMSTHTRSVRNIGPNIDVDQIPIRTSNSPPRNIGPDVEVAPEIWTGR